MAWDNKCQDDSNNDSCQNPQNQAGLIILLTSDFNAVNFSILTSWIYN